MKTVILDAIAYGLTYLLLAAVFTSLMGVVNRLSCKPFLDQWKSRLFWFTFSLATGCLLDMLPRKLVLAIGFPTAFVLLAVALWVFAKHPNRKGKIREGINPSR